MDTPSGSTFLPSLSDQRQVLPSSREEILRHAVERNRGEGAEQGPGRDEDQGQGGASDEKHGDEGEGDGGAGGDQDHQEAEDGGGGVGLVGLSDPVHVGGLGEERREDRSGGGQQKVDGATGEERGRPQEKRTAGGDD